MGCLSERQHRPTLDLLKMFQRKCDYCLDYKAAVVGTSFEKDVKAENGISAVCPTFCQVYGLPKHFGKDLERIFVSCKSFPTKHICKSVCI